LIVESLPRVQKCETSFGFQYYFLLFLYYLLTNTWFTIENNVNYKKDSKRFVCSLELYLIPLGRGWDTTIKVMTNIFVNNVEEGKLNGTTFLKDYF